MGQERRRGARVQEELAVVVSFSALSGSRRGALSAGGHGISFYCEGFLFKRLLCSVGT